MLKSILTLAATALAILLSIPGHAQSLRADRESADFYNPCRVDKTNPFDPPPSVPYKY